MAHILSAEQVSRIQYEAKNIPIFFSANMSLGVNLLMDLVARASKILEDTFDIMFETEDILAFDTYVKGIDILKKYGIEM